eukprot:TRINITY_DN3065_c0_g1_i2.p1 TRINITY_DN3065_c0_g1~~TRINITY_DN3065_c0_g1_i2.p1  ORF type:complete len:138 (-),score=51.96 TRINITY_DN3065_c0_g1_i2:114-527(-)
MTMEEINDLRCKLNIFTRLLIESDERVIRWWREVCHMLYENQCQQQLKLNAEKEVEVVRGKVERLSQELTASRISYQKMINEMTEHVCMLTEKLAQKDATNTRQRAMASTAAAATTAAAAALPGNAPAGSASLAETP